MSHVRLIESEAELEGIVSTMRTVAVIGMKDERKAHQPAHEIPAMLAARGCEIIPINPNIKAALGVPALKSMAELQGRVDVMNVFRRSDAIPALADEILALPEEKRPVVVWLQSGIRHDEAAERLAKAGVAVVQDRCLGVYAARYRRR